MNTGQMERLFKPDSVVIFSRYDDSQILSSRPMANLIFWGYRGNVYQVIVDGILWNGWEKVSALEDPPDIAMISLSPEESIDALNRCSAMAIPFVIMFSSLSVNQLPEYKDVLELAQSRGTRVLGPNCQGLANFADKIPLSWSSALDMDHPSDGHVALVSQSGDLGFSAYSMASDEGVRFRYVVTTGLSSDVDVVDVGHWLIEDYQVHMIVFYLEGLPEGRDFLKMVREAQSRGVSVAVLRGGVSPRLREFAAGRRGHGSVADEGVWKTVAKQFGMVLLDDIADLIDLGRIVDMGRNPKGCRVAVVSTSGGVGMIQADKCVSAGLDMAPIDPKSREILGKCLKEDGYLDGILTLDSQVIESSQHMNQVLKVLSDSPDVDIILVAVPVISAGAAEKLADTLIGASLSFYKPLVCCWLTDDIHGGHGAQKLRRSGIPLFDSPRRCADAVAAWVGAVKPCKKRELSCSPVSNPILGGYPDVLNGYEAACFIESYGLTPIRQAFCLDLDEVLAGGNDIGFPLALKVVSREIGSKKEARGIALNLRTEEELQNAYGRILERAVRSSPDAVIDGVLVQEMVSDGIECMVGMKRDPVFGPVVAVGLGGILYDVIKDLSLRLAPVDFPMALEMVESLKGYPLFAGFRGSKALDFRSLAAEVVKVSAMSCAEPDLVLLDIGSIFVTPGGVKIADVRVRKRGEVK
ncbi:acetate--CoA ligase family protein [Dethiosulfovibrio salsuginis]|uniref:Acyl-CoA synthetase (NDP forming) n=1 Tax=Dethiosulfovibrio salsuginis TaxID=561720 RepID=A0A1X7KMR3_9BACT|nr:acetate--CoA ligase family protein [Dethiosulfovibrio salsuginis]SMG42378.1 Acyl-CoA synthetase (NDP forming) [Dethiosulfovibrio salsuginis]